MPINATGAFSMPCTMSSLYLMRPARIHSPIWRSAPGQASREWLRGLFALNGFLNVLWSLLYFRMRRPDWALLEVGLLWLSVLLLMVVELLNTAIEKLADRLTTDHDKQIGRVKDMGSAAVGVTLLIAGGVWLFAIAERIGLI